MTATLQARRNTLIAQSNALPNGRAYRAERARLAQLVNGYNARILQTIGAAVRTPSQALDLA